MFSRVCVSHSVHGGGDLCMMSLPVWLPGPMFFSGGLPGPMFLPGGSLSSGSLSRVLCLGGLCLGVSVREW